MSASETRSITRMDPDSNDVNDPDVEDPKDAETPADPAQAEEKGPDESDSRRKATDRMPVVTPDSQRTNTQTATRETLKDTTLWSEVPDLRFKLLQVIDIAHLLDKPTIEEVVDRSAAGEGTLPQVLIEGGYMHEGKLVECLEKASGYPAVDPRHHKPTRTALDLFDLETVLAERVVPLKVQGDRLLLVMENPVNRELKAAIMDRLHLQIEPYIFHTNGIFEAIAENYRGVEPAQLDTIARSQGDLCVDAPEEIEVRRERKTQGILFRPLSDVLFSRVTDILWQPLFNTKEVVTEKIKVPRSPIEGERIQAYTASPDSAASVTDLILRQALAVKATDVHIEPFEDAIRIRVRRDQMLSTLNYLALEMHSSVVNRIKVLADLNLAERRKIQEGAFPYEYKDGQECTFRVSIIPSSRGESVELRVIDGRQGSWDLAELGMTSADLTRFETNLVYPNGLILITGPTASGKTTTMYSSLKRLNIEGRKIISAEDPIEFDLYGITQVEVNHRTGISYAAALKAFLRQDPDIIMLGEIRDSEVADVAVSAALTGHLVLAALHTNDAASAPSRMLSTLDVDPLLLCDSLLMVCAQRLVRMLCPHCIEEQPIDPVYLQQFGEEALVGVNVDHFSPGCKRCRETGFAGVEAVFEIMDATPDVKELIYQRSPTSHIYDLACRQGMIPMTKNALDLVRAGRTSLAEVGRVLMYKRLF